MKVINNRLPAVEAVAKFEGHLATFDGYVGILVKNGESAVNGYVGAIQYRKEGDKFCYFRAFRDDVEITVFHFGTYMAFP